MPQVINITNEDISYSESILLPVGKTFDDERRTFIHNLETIDLQAVPGSGKTTALLAKLLILEKKLPFDDGSGVLVISHTNSAIDEIKDKIQKYCPKLFSYPNFIGTIQSFVDEFLTVPFYLTKFKKKPIRIDNEIYFEKVSEFSRLFFKGFTNQEQNNAKRVLRVNDLFLTLRLSYSNNESILTNGYNGNPISFSKPRGNTRPQNYTDWLQNDKDKVKEWLFTFKKYHYAKGVLSFDDAYFLAETYLRQFPTIKVILQKRFTLVFVDEMQDMDKHQYDLLEILFYDGGNSISNYQRIGDKNQSIFNGEAKVEMYWTDRNVVLPLTGSQRLTPAITNIVSNFALYRPAGFGIVGLEVGIIKPHIIKYSTATIQNVFTTFFNIVRQLKEQPENENFRNRLIELKRDGTHKYPIKIIAWNTIWKTHAEKENDSKVRLVDYFPSFSKEEHKPKTDYLCLKSYLYYYDKNKNTLESIRKNILNSFLRILRFEEILDPEGRYFTKKKLIDSIKELSENNRVDKYDAFKLNLYQWSFDIIRGKSDQVYESMVRYIPCFLEIFGKKINNCKEFLTSSIEVAPENEVETAAINKVQFDELEVEVTTVHSVKGQTHAATLYLESSYYGLHETERLSYQFLGQAFNDNRVYHKQSTKMAYVGLSRPTDLLCIAVHIDRYNQFLNTINIQEWEIEEA